ncbi:MAG: type II secretion system minor pseudopilin GspJ [Proteobacteria bacterium]|nr:type II secretion system minor pseudopilin GspJ [Pseudomonadota bacterium]
MVLPRVQKAFTLIEVLVAFAIFGILAAFAYGALSQTLLSAEILGERMDRLQAIQKSVRYLSHDFLQLAPRPVRQELGDSFDPALLTDFSSEFALELTHGGWSNPVALPRGTLQRSAYRLEDDELVRYYWTVLDRTLSNEAIGVTILDGVESLLFRYLLDSGDWIEQWPPPTLPGPLGLRQRPRAVEIVLTLQDEGEIRRIIEIAP